MPVHIRPLAARELPAAVALLSRAFRDDPFLNHYFADPRRRRLAVPAFFAPVVYAQLPAGHIYAARDEGRLVGVAVWAPPDAGPPTRALRALAAVSERFVRVLFPSTTAGLLAGFAELERHHPPEPHWYLPFIGVEPGRQGTGIGERLLRPVLDLADAAGRACYLETPFPRTHAFYERLGFEHVAELRPFPSAEMPVWTMLRRPR